MASQKQIKWAVVLALCLPAIARAQVSIQPPQPRFLETVHLIAPASALTEYDAGRTLVSMNGSAITVSIQLNNTDPFGAPVAPVDVVLGQLPTGNYDVTLVTLGTNGTPVTTIGPAHFSVAARDFSKFSPQYDYTDLWWNPNESGWGLTITQHPSTNIFAAWYVYGSDGKTLLSRKPVRRRSYSPTTATAPSPTPLMA